MRLLSALFALLTSTSVLAGIFDRCDYTAPRSASASAAGVSRIVIIGRAGSLRVEGRAGTQVQATGTACVSDRALLNDTRLTAQRYGSELRIEALVPDTGMFQRAALDFEVTLPANIPVMIKDGSGSLTIAGTYDLTVDDGSGSLQIRNITGNLSVEDGSGSISISNVTGDVRIVDGSGSIEVEHIGGSVTIPSDSSGSVDIRDVKRKRDHRIERLGQHLGCRCRRRFPGGAQRRRTPVVRPGGGSGGRARPKLIQCRKCRSPVNSMLMPCSFAAAMTSSSRTEPPG